jgi:hypothetical protein
LQPLVARPDIYPLDVRVVVDGKDVGTLRVGGESNADVSLDVALPPVPGSPAAVEVTLMPSRYAITRPFGAALVSAARIVRVEVL